MTTSPLQTSIKVGKLTLPNRIIMAPLTRCRAGEGYVPLDIHATYYQQRASAGLLISEATQIMPEGAGYPNTPGIYSDAQIAGWQKVTDAVHAAGGRIFLQIWHVGRISHSSYQPGGKLPVAPSAIAAEGKVRDPNGVQHDYEVPHALTVDEIEAIVEQYAQATRNARAAGFDGVEIHGANTYLIDQFLRESSNVRTDQYGGSRENRARFLREVVAAVVGAWDAGSVGLRLSPDANYHGMSDSDTEATFVNAARIADEFGLAYLHIVEAENTAKTITPALRKAFSGPLMVCGGYEKATGAAVVEQNQADLVAYGRRYISNPDLPERFAADAPLNEWDASTFYGGSEAGYTDYPTLAEASVPDPA